MEPKQKLTGENLAVARSGASTARLSTPSSHSFRTLDPSTRTLLLSFSTSQLAAISGTALNYLSRKDPDGSGGLSSAAQAVGSASQAVLSAYNSVAEFEQENKLIDGALAFVSDKAGDSEVLDTIGGALNSAGDFIEDNDLVGGAGTALASLGDLLETGLDKAVALVEENI